MLMKIVMKKNRLQWEVLVPALTERAANAKSTCQNYADLLAFYQADSFLQNESNFLCLQISERLWQRINRNKSGCYAG
jgi:hypothetical protein